MILRPYSGGLRPMALMRVWESGMECAAGLRRVEGRVYNI